MKEGPGTTQPKPTRAEARAPQRQEIAPAPAANAESHQLQVPTISLPKGGGAIRGMGEKFAANPVTGTGSMTVPIAVSPGRGGFGPQLSLAYDSGAGNGPFGLGWNLSLPAITRKTDKGLSHYNDAENSDVFLLSGAEDLVPVLNADGSRFEDKDTAPGITIHRFRPRIEGLFARIERWTAAGGATSWRTITKDNITTWYGKTAASRIADPHLPRRIFSWLICESYDDKGNAIVYEYEADTAANTNRRQGYEANRDPRSCEANRYLKRIKYGNRLSRLAQPELSQMEWLFEAVLDYGDHDKARPTPQADHSWPIREDSFSTYRAGFEVRTYRLCRRVLMFHHFAELGVEPCLVRSTDFYHTETPVASFLDAVTQNSYVRQRDNHYVKKSLPPVEFKYAEAGVNHEVKTIDAGSLENLPMGVDGAAYQWVDLDGEGLSGVLTEQADAWFYKRNLGNGQFAPEERISKFAPMLALDTKPSLANLAGGAQQLMSLANDGCLNLVQFAPPLSGFYERTGDYQWESFRPFRSNPNLNWQDPNLRFIDLTGDGFPDILITEDDLFVWHPSLAKEGFGPAAWVRKVQDEESGPALVFADATQTIFLADMSSDGLTDIVRIRNGEVCYWPNLGYGRFGAKVTMARAPHFDHPDQFNPSRIRLADIDGSGTTDVLYLGRNVVRYWINQSGNGFSREQELPTFPHTDNLASVAAVDLLGNGTACLVWSSPLSRDAHQPMRYIELMSGKKPYLLGAVKNNLGAETTIQYAASTKFYLADRSAGKPWITRLPFPVHCVEKVTVKDKWRGTEFSTNYSYHHGYYDGVEREFRGFGRVEQVDTEDFGVLATGNYQSPYITDDQRLYQPPVKTITWFHTGAFADRQHILSQMAREYFPNWLGDRPLQGGFRENALPEPDLDTQNLTAAEWREALRACKGMTLRQEVYELDVDELAQGRHVRVKLFSTAYHNCHIQRLQPKATNKHAVFLVTESEAITYNYELDLRTATLTPDPRIAHTLNLRTDEYGNIQQAVAVVYPRLGDYADASLTSDTVALINQVQKEWHVAYTETRYTNDVTEPNAQRLRVPCDVRMYELTGLRPAENRYFTLGELRAYSLSDVYQPTLTPNVASLEYHELPNHQTPQKRKVEDAHTLFFHENLRDPLPLGRLNALGLPYENYKLALTDSLLSAILQDKYTKEVRNRLDDEALSGYVMGADLLGRFPDEDLGGQYWIRSGIAGFNAGAAEHYYLPERYTDPFGNTTVLEYDALDLYIKSSADPLGNKTAVTKFDFRVLAPQEIKVPNNNFAEVAFDLLGMPAAVAIKGKGNEADNLENITSEILNPSSATLQQFFTDDYHEAEARRLLGNATARHLYYFGETINADGSITWGAHPACACGILREQHARTDSPLQTAFEYSDGTGTVLVKKAQAEPAPNTTTLRWIASGKTILNNKGKPVKQYEPYFSPSDAAHRFEEPREVGVTPVLYYDAPGRLIRTELPDGSLSRVEFSPWHVRSFDQNDTVLESGSTWRVGRTLNAATALHADTPATIFFDSLGREVVSVAHNKFTDRTGALHDEKFVTFTKLDAEGKPLWIRDARGNRVMQYIVPCAANNAPLDPTSGFVPCYDIAGNLLFQHSMDAGDRWTLNDAAGKPMFAWDFNERQEVVTDGPLIPEHRFLWTAYDALHRPTALWLRINDDAPQMIERFVYGEGLPNAATQNLCGQLYQHYDQSGLLTNVRFDFSGNLLEAQRQLASQFKAPVIGWQGGSATTGLDAETWTQIVEYDALNRMRRQFNWHQGTDSRVAVYEPAYNPRGVLQSERIIIRAVKTASGYELRADSRTETAIEEIAYNAKGQRTSIRYGNGTTTRYEYDPQAFRLLQLRTTRRGFQPDFPNSIGLKDANVLQNLYYTYDPVGNITEIYDDAFDPAFFRNQQVEARNAYSYDATYRLIAASGRENYHATGAPNGKQTPPFVTNFPIDSQALRNYTEYYRYDAVGNILEMRHAAGDAGSWTRQYEYAPDSNRLLQTNHTTNPTDAVRYLYDTHGSMRNLANVAPAHQLRWDYRDMISALDLEGGGWAYYNYDSQKQRTRKRLGKPGGLVEERLYLGGLELYRRSDASGTVQEEIETLHLFADDQRVLLVDDVRKTDQTALGTGTLLRYQYSNHLGSVGLELDDEGEVISYEEYHPYGTTAYQANGAEVRATKKRYRYTGMERDEESGLSYHMARYYLPGLGRWCSADPTDVRYGINVFVYSTNNPVLRADKNGLVDYEFYIRSFAPFREFGSLDLGIFGSEFPGLSYAGDARGFSIDPDSTARITERVRIRDWDSSHFNVDSDVYSSPSQGPGFDAHSGLPDLAASATEIPDEDLTVTPQSDSRLLIQTHYAGNNPLLPSPDIDVFSRITLERESANRLHITAQFEGDAFPSTEAFIRDSAGNALFIGLHMAEGEHPATSLPGENHIPVSSLSFTVITDDQGSFISVIYQDAEGNEHTLSLNEWNAQVELNAMYEYAMGPVMERTAGGTPMPSGISAGSSDAGVSSDAGISYPAGDRSGTEWSVEVPRIRIPLRPERP